MPRTRCGISTKTISSFTVSVCCELNMYFSKGISPKSGSAADRLAFGVLENAAQQVGLAFLHADDLLKFLVSDDRLLNSTQIAVAGDVGDLMWSFMETSPS